MVKKPKASIIVIKKVKKGGRPAAQHGGAWKVAYADFVTAMMAFFLLLWLLSTTTDVQKRAIAEYFDPTLTSESMSGAGGVLGGQTMGKPGSEPTPPSQPNFSVSIAIPTQPTTVDDADGGANTDEVYDRAAPPVETDKPRNLTDDELQKQLARSEQRRFDEAKNEIEQALREVPELQALAENLFIDETSQGLRIQIVDRNKMPMYALGSAEMLDPAKKLLALVTQVIDRLPNKISIAGHTDSTQYALSARYTNWELSADRANASRREFLADGLPANRIARVAGEADRDPLDKGDRTAPRNRRISIVLLRETNDDPAAAAPPRGPITRAASANP